MIVYAATIFLSAFLLFQVQPLIAKFILPWFGGSAAVWSAALLFFQLLDALDETFQTLGRNPLVRLTVGHAPYSSKAG